MPQSQNPDVASPSRRWRAGSQSSPDAARRETPSVVPARDGCVVVGGPRHGAREPSDRPAARGAGAPRGAARAEKCARSVRPTGRGPADRGGQAIRSPQKRWQLRHPVVEQDLDLVIRDPSVGLECLEARPRRGGTCCGLVRHRRRVVCGRRRPRCHVGVEGIGPTLRQMPRVPLPGADRRKRHPQCCRTPRLRVD